MFVPLNSSDGDDDLAAGPAFLDVADRGRGLAERVGPLDGGHDLARLDEDPEPAPLSRERILRAAVAFADSSGIASLSMRKLGEVLGVEAMSLYNHVASKGDLLDGMIDLVFSEIGLPSGEAGWKTAMRQRAVSAREVLIRHRWAIGLMESRSSPGPAPPAGRPGQ